MTGRVKGFIDRNIHRYRDDPDYGNCLPKWLMFVLVSVIKKQYGAAYNPEVAAASHASQRYPMDDARDVFLNGLLDENRKHRHGTCASFPVLVAAIGRRLGYPVKLAVAGRHVFARWEGDGVRFNIESTGPMGMTIHSDEKYRDDYLNDEHKSSTYYLRTLTAAEEFALFMTFRVEALQYAGRYEETPLWSARALQFAPDDPGFLHWASSSADLALKHRLWRRHPEIKIPPIDDPKPFFFQIGDLMRLEERSLYLTISAHQKEADGEIDEARKLYEESCRQNFYGNNEQRDLQRFLKKYNLPCRPRPLLPPENLGQPRRFKLFCKPHEEASWLRKMANDFHGRGEYLKSRNALQDLYMFDPGDAEVFQATRKITQYPEFQTQLRAAIAKQQKPNKGA